MTPLAGSLLAVVAVVALGWFVWTSPATPRAYRTVGGCRAALWLARAGLVAVLFPAAVTASTLGDRGVAETVVDVVFIAACVAVCGLLMARGTWPLARRLTELRRRGSVSSVPAE